MIALCLIMLVLGDLIVLKDGKTIEGVYVSEDDESVRFRVASGQVKSEPKSNIARIERRRTKTNVYETIASTLTAEEPADYLYLCAWADEQGLDPHVESLCRVAASAEELAGRALFRLSRNAAEQEARGLARSAVAASPELAAAARALRSARDGGTRLPREFLLTFTGAVDCIITGSYPTALSRSRQALARLDVAARAELDALFSRHARMKTDACLSRLEALVRATGEGPMCTHCRGTGLLPCAQCGGRGWKTCPNCRGRGYKTKMIVHATGQKDQFRECGACRGSGRISCRLCIPLKPPVTDDIFIELPRRLENHDQMPHARSAGAWQYRRSETNVEGDAATTSTSRYLRGVSVPFERRGSGNRLCPHCAGKRKGKLRRFTPNELAGLAELNRTWKEEIRSAGGGWSGQGKLCGLGDLYEALGFEPAAATAFYEGKWLTPGARKMYLSARKQSEAPIDTSGFDEWKARYKCRILAEEAIRIPAESRAWLSLFKLYLQTQETRLTRRYSSRQVYCAAFRPGAGEASVLSPRGELLAVSGKRGLALRPDRPVETGGAGEVEIWFRITGAEADRAAVLSVRVLGAKRGGKTVAFF